MLSKMSKRENGPAGGKQRVKNREREREIHVYV